MTSVQRKFAAGIISLFMIPSINCIGQTTRLTPDDSAEPIYVFTQSPTPTPKPPKTADTAHNVDRQIPDHCKSAEKIFSEEAKERGIEFVIRIKEKKGDDGKPFLQISGKVSKSKVSASQVKESFNALVNKCKADNTKVKSALVIDSRIK